MSTEVIEADDTGSASDYGSSLPSDTTSITSSITDFQYENGRRYQRKAIDSRALPNDEREQDRLDLYHHMCLLLLKGNLHAAELDKPQRILDLGCGTGLWALDMAETYPSAEVIGVDISPIQPQWTWPNCRFEVDDIELDWTYAKDSFSFIHSRILQQNIKDWKKYLKQIYEHLEPTGQFEIVEYDFFFHSDDDTFKGSPLEKYQTTFAAAAEKVKFEFQSPEGLKKLAEDTGFEDVKIYRHKQPMGAWAKDKYMKQLGHYAAMIVETGFESHALTLFTRALGMKPEEAKKICDDSVEMVMKDRKVHSYNYVWRVVGTKPAKA